MPNIAMLYHGNNEELHPAHRGFAESINADLVSVSNKSPHSKKSFLQEFSRGYSIGDYDTVVAEGSRPLYTGLIHKVIHKSNLVYLCADHRLYDLWNNSVEVDSAYSYFKYILGTHGKPGVQTVSQHSIDGIIAVSDFVEEYLRPIFQDRVPTRIAHPYIQPEQYEQLGRVIPDVSQKVALTVGRSSRYKGVDLLVDAWPKVREEHPNAELRIVGNGHPESYANTPGVNVLGFVDDIVEAYADTGLYVQPSRVDPFPVTVLEALRTGLPTVVTESTGNYTEIVKLDDELIAPTTAEGLSKAINWYFDRSQAEKNNLSKKAENCGEQFGPEYRKRAFREEFRKLQTEINPN